MDDKNPFSVRKENKDNLICLSFLFICLTIILSLNQLRILRPLGRKIAICRLIRFFLCLLLTCGWGCRAEVCSLCFCVSMCLWSWKAFILFCKCKIFSYFWMVLINYVTVRLPGRVAFLGVRYRFRMPTPPLPLFIWVWMWWRCSGVGNTRVP